MAVKPIPDGYRSVTPYLIVKGAVAAMDFYKTAFGATEVLRLDTPDGGIAHAEFKVGDSIVMMADEFPDRGVVGPKTLGGSPVHFLIYVENVDAFFAHALASGATELRPIVDQFYGDRSGTLVDPFGHQWTIATHVEDMTQEEMNRRMAAMFASQG